MANSEPFLAEGISLGIPNDSATDISVLDNAISVDTEGNIVFKDSYTSSLIDENGNPLSVIRLKDLITRVKGIFVKEGKLYFKDESVSRPYSLKELIDSYIEWKSRLSTGGLYWLGSTRITNNECNNIIVNVLGDANIEPNTPIAQGVGRIFTKSPITGEYPTDAIGTKLFSIDEYLNTLTDYDALSNPRGFAYGTDGSMRWHDIPNLKLTIPPLDANKSVMILAKLNVRLIKSDTPILFRLIDTTTNNELDRKSIMNSALLPMEQQPILTYVGKLSEYTSSLNKIDCACTTVNDAIILENNPVRILAVQFHVDEKLTSDDTIMYTSCENVSGVHFNGLERRIIGLPNSISETPIVNMNIDAIIYDVSSSDTIGRKAGNVTFTNQDSQDIVFERPFTGTNYTISLSCGKNINTWYTNKKSTGFTIKSEIKMTGSIDWIATKLKFEGDA